MPRILHIGLGQIGRSAVQSILAQAPHLQLVAVVDINPALAGKNLRDILPGKHIPPLGIQGCIHEALKSKPEVATLTTGSRTIDIRPDLQTLTRAGIHCVSTCEELAYPKLRTPKLAAELDRLAQRHRVAILGTGVNPGFAMDAFALAATAPCIRIDAIHITRSLDARHRRQQLQKKIGSAMSLAAVKKLIAQKAIGHVGLGESIALLAEGLNWKIDAIHEKFTPIVAEKPIATEFFHVKKGEVRGLHMVAHALVSGKKRIHLDLTMALGADTFDDIRIIGSPNLHIRTTTGFPGDPSTIGLLINSARIAPALPPGLRTMLDVFKARALGA